LPLRKAAGTPCPRQRRGRGCVLYLPPVEKQEVREQELGRSLFKT